MQEEVVVERSANHLTCLPVELFHRVLKYLAYDSIAALRTTNQYFNKQCGAVLNAGFKSLEHEHAKCWQVVKSRLPRRESERRKHVLSRHNDILSAFETRLSLLNMTYPKFIDLNLCCFIPGKVLDEGFSVLRVVKRSLDDANFQPPKPLDLLQELRDVSSMAMEHFDEQVAPGLKDNAMLPGSSKDISGLSLLIGATPSSSCLVDKLTSDMAGGSQQHGVCSSSWPPQLLQTPGSAASDAAGAGGVHRLKRSLAQLQKRVHSQSTQLACQRSELSTLRASTGSLHTKLRLQRARVHAQNRLVNAQAKKLDQLTSTVKELNKRVLDYGAHLTESDTAIDQPPSSSERSRKRKAKHSAQTPPSAKRSNAAGYNLRRRGQ